MTSQSAASAQQPTIAVDANSLSALASAEATKILTASSR